MQLIGKKNTASEHELGQLKMFL